MDKKEIFVKSIYINQVRHLKDFIIPISDVERKQLILTGKNGSGKTSVLDALKECFKDMLKFYYKDLCEKHVNLVNNILEIKGQKQVQSSKRLSEFDELRYIEGNISYSMGRNGALQEIIADINEIFDLKTTFEKSKFIVAFFEARRGSNLKQPKGINKIDLNESYSIDEKANSDFIQYLVNLKAQRSFARDEKKTETVNAIDNWFELFENFLKEIFEDENLKLEFNSEEFNFNIIQRNRSKFDFNTLADGYSAILNIITELILRMEKTKTKNYDIQGIVLIDEIETHLHIDLQKKVLPFLTRFFPKIQFIVTTHSPFVLNSLPNAVIYDLENHILVEDLSGYSVDGIIEGYFNADKYSDVLKDQVKEYEELLNSNNRNKVEEERIDYLSKHFNDLSKFMAPELQLKLQQLQLQNL